MNVLQMLQARLMQNAGFAQQEEGQAGDQPLPDAVLRSIYGQPSYAEGQWMPRAPNPALEQERAALLGPRREDALAEAMRQVRAARQGTDTIPDAFSNADWINGNYSFRRPDPLNSMMGRYPLALY